MHPDVVKVLPGKPQLVFRRILAMLGYLGADGVFNTIVSGFNIVSGWAMTGVFQRKYVKCSKSLQDLWTAACAVEASCEAMPPMTEAIECISLPPQRQNSETRSSSIGVVERLSSLVTSVTHCLSIETSDSTSESVSYTHLTQPTKRIV